MQYKCSAFGVAVRVNNVCGAWNGGNGYISSMATWRLMDVLMDGKTAVLQDAEFLLAIFRTERIIRHFIVSWPGQTHCGHHGQSFGG